MVEIVESVSKGEIIDTTRYPVSETVGEELLQRLIMELLRPLVERWLQESGRRALVGADQFFYYEQFNPRKSVAPDIYVVEGVSPDAPVTAWKVWEHRVVPSFALEVVSGDRLKDYVEAPKRHGELGTKELVVFDPHWDEGPSSRVLWQVYRREGSELVCMECTGRDRVRSNTLSCWLRATGEGSALRVRVGLDPDGTVLLPSEAERAEAEAQRAAAATQRAARAEAQVERLLARLRTLGDDDSTP